MGIHSLKIGYPEGVRFGTKPCAVHKLIVMHFPGCQILRMFEWNKVSGEGSFTVRLMLQPSGQVLAVCLMGWEEKFHASVDFPLQRLFITTFNYVIALVNRLPHRGMEQRSPAKAVLALDENCCYYSVHSTYWSIQTDSSWLPRIHLFLA